MPGDSIAKRRRLRAVPSSGDDEARSLETLVGLARRGDALAWTEIYELEFEGIYRHLGFMVHDPSVAEELAQETFVVAFRKLHDFDGRSALSTWMHGIAVNLARSHFRKESRRRRAYDGLAQSLVTRSPSARVCPELSHDRERRALALLAAVESLAPRLREAFTLLELRQLPRDEVASLLGISRMAVSVRASRARKLVSAHLRRQGWFEGEGGTR